MIATAANMRGTLCRTSPKRPIDAICVPIEVILTSVFSELAIEIRDDTRSKETTMPLWKVYHPVGAYTREDKHALSKRITDVYAEVPLPKFYVSGGINDTCEIHGCNRLSGQGPPSRDRRFESHFPAKSRANDGHRCDLVANSDPGLASLAEICARLGVSHRFLRKCCEQNLGISPARVPRSSGKTQVV